MAIGNWPRDAGLSWLDRPPTPLRPVLAVHRYRHHRITTLALGHFGFTLWRALPGLRCTALLHATQRTRGFFGEAAMLPSCWPCPLLACSSAT